MIEKINVYEVFSQFEENLRPKTIATLNGQEVKVVKIKGEFPWHFHESDDEFFMVRKGLLPVEFRDHVVEMAPGECVVTRAGSCIAAAQMLRRNS